MKPPTIEEVLSRVTQAAGDGYVPGENIIQSWNLPRREAVRALRRAIGGGYLLERRGPDKRTYVAVSSEGWRSSRIARGQLPAFREVEKIPEQLAQRRLDDVAAVRR